MVIKEGRWVKLYIISPTDPLIIDSRNFRGQKNKIKPMFCQKCLQFRGKNENNPRFDDGLLSPCPKSGSF